MSTTIRQRELEKIVIESNEEVRGYHQIGHARLLFVYSESKRGRRKKIENWYEKVEEKAKKIAPPKADAFSLGGSIIDYYGSRGSNYKAYVAVTYHVRTSKKPCQKA